MLCFVLVPVSCTFNRLFCDEGAFRACPCTSPRHKDVRAFVCVLVPSLYVGRLVTRERFGHAHAPLFVLKTYKHLWLCSRPLPCTFGRLVTRERFGLAHAPLLFIKTNGHLCLCSRSLPCAFIFRAHLCLYPLVHSAHAVILKPWLVTINENTGPTKRGNEPLLEK